MSQASPEAKRRYDQSPKGRARRARDRQSAANRERQRRYWASEKGKAAQARYHASAKGRAKTSRAVHKRRAAMQIVSTLTADQWETLKASTGGACVYCGRTDKPLTQDHVVPLSKGGHHTMENVVPACKSCNSRRGNGELPGRNGKPPVLPAATSRLPGM